MVVRWVDGKGEDVVVERHEGVRVKHNGQGDGMSHTEGRRGVSRAGSV